MPAADVEPPEIAEIRNRIAHLAPEVERLGMTAVFVFGPADRGHNRPDGSVDLYIDDAPGSSFSLVDITRLSEQFGTALDRTADIHIRGSLHPLVWARVTTQAFQVL